MNLIEQLGGYGKAKKTLGIFGILRTEFLDGLFKKDLQEALLQYRREHNIFEVGDKVVVLTMHLNRESIYVVSSVLGDLTLISGHYFYKIALRHATDAEIKAGRRL